MRQIIDKQVDAAGYNESLLSHHYMQILLSLYNECISDYMYQLPLIHMMTDFFHTLC
jgi:hypothetical protein